MSEAESKDVKADCEAKEVITATDSEKQNEADAEMETKIDSTTEEKVKVDLDPELEQKIIKQVEFYYGDINLTRDKFLQEQIKLDDGWVPLETMLKFNRLKSMCEDEALVAAALRKSTSGLLEVSEDGKKIRRTPAKPVPAPSKEQLDIQKMRSVYAKKFPFDATLDQMMEFFEKFGKTELIVMRKDGRKLFKGSCFVVYESDDAATKFLKEPNLKYKETDSAELIREYKHEYYLRKADEKKQHHADRTKAKEEMKAKRDSEAQNDASKQLVSGAVLSIENMPKSAKVDEIRTFFSKYGDVKWVDCNESDKDSMEVRVRFGDVDGAKSALEKAKESDGGKITFKNIELTCTVLEGDAELEHWKNLIQSKKDRKSRDRGGYNKGKRGFRGKRDFPQRKRAKYGANDDGSDGGNSD